MTKRAEVFKKRAARGRLFETWERSKWTKPGHTGKEDEAPTTWQGKRGRIDLRLIEKEDGYSVVVEIKATDWDRMAPHRIRPNVLRHARQLWRYIEAELIEQSVVPAIVYPCEPEAPGRKEEIEAILNERLIQVVWREVDLGAL